MKEEGILSSELWYLELLASVPLPSASRMLTRGHMKKSICMGILIPRLHLLLANTVHYVFVMGMKENH